MTIWDWIGHIGVAITLIAYFCMSFKWMSAEGRPFFLLNTVGAALTCLSACVAAFYPVVILEGTWTIVSLIALIRVRN